MWGRIQMGEANSVNIGADVLVTLHTWRCMLRPRKRYKNCAEIFPLLRMVFVLSVLALRYRLNSLDVWQCSVLQMGRPNIKKVGAQFSDRRMNFFVLELMSATCTAHGAEVSCVHCVEYKPVSLATIADSLE